MKFKIGDQCKKVFENDKQSLDFIASVIKIAATCIGKLNENYYTHVINDFFFNRVIIHF